MSRPRIALTCLSLLGLSLASGCTQGSSPAQTDAAKAQAAATTASEPSAATPGDSVGSAAPQISDPAPTGAAAAATPTGMAAAATSNGLETGPASPEIIANARKIQKQLECLRGRKFKRDPEVAFQSLADFRAYVDKQLAKELGGEKGAQIVRTLHALDIVDPSVDVMKQLVEAAVGQAAAYYDPETNTFYVVQNMPEMMLNSVMAHELQHALQDQHTSLLDDYLAEGFGSSDKDLATRFVVEGEATLLGHSWLVNHIQSKLPGSPKICHLPEAKEGDPRSFWPSLTPIISEAAGQTRDDIVNPGMLERVAMSSMSEGMGDSLRQLRELPVYFFYSLLLPYNQGGQTVFTHFTSNGYDWASIDALFTTPPETTEQVLHPAKLMGEREGFRQHELADAPAVSAESASAWASDPSDRLGELSVRIWLIEEGAEENVASGAAAGWDGDSIRVWRKGEDLLAFDWKIGWDTPRDQKEFLAQLPAALAKQRGLDPKGLSSALLDPGEEGMLAFNWTDSQQRTRHGRIEWSGRLIHWTDGWDEPVQWTTSK
jgi:hypothetical protein